MLHSVSHELRMPLAGVPAGEAERIFERFYRSGVGLMGRCVPAGMGLGLCIVRALVQAHGGRVRVEARAGGGSRFTTTWPFSPADAPSTASGAAAATVATQEPSGR